MKDYYALVKWSVLAIDLEDHTLFHTFTIGVKPSATIQAVAREAIKCVFGRYNDHGAPDVIEVDRILYVDLRQGGSLRIERLRQ